MKKVVVFGTGDFSDIVSYILKAKLHNEPEAYTVNEKYLTGDTYNDRPLVAFEKLTELYPPSEYDIVVGFIGKQMFRQREEAVNRILEKGYHLANVIDPAAAVDTEMIGQGNVILANASIESHCKIGDCNIIWQNVVMPHHNQLGSFNNLAPSVSFSGYSKVGSHCFVGNNACIKNRVEVHDYAYIGAGSYISRDVETDTVMVPSRSYALDGKKGFDFL